jgi:hypothetical protein
MGRRASKYNRANAKEERKAKYFVNWSHVQLQLHTVLEK